MNPQPLEPMTFDSPKIPGLYIHIPFCLKKCNYCNFYSLTSLSSIPEFLKALFQEMGMVRDQFGPLDTLYIGGGTPSLLTLKQLESILAHIQKKFVLLPDPEITLEANPGDLNLSFLRDLRNLGINRLNIGIQSFDQKILDFLGRRHSLLQAISAIENSRIAGFQNIGLDLIYGIPGQDMESWRDTLIQTFVFSPEHLSCYQLTIEANTPLGVKHQKGEFALPGEEMQYNFFMKTAKWLKEAGYLHYEVSNFAKNITFASRHNQKYWTHTPYLGHSRNGRYHKGSDNGREKTRQCGLSGRAHI